MEIRFYLFGGRLTMQKGGVHDLKDSDWKIHDLIKTAKKKFEAGDDVKLLLEVIRDTNEEYKSKEIVNTIIGKSTIITSNKNSGLAFFDPVIVNKVRSSVNN